MRENCSPKESMFLGQFHLKSYWPGCLRPFKKIAAGWSENNSDIAAGYPPDKGKIAAGGPKSRVQAPP